MKKKIYIKALNDNKLVDIDLDTIKKQIFDGIDQNEWTYLFTIKSFTGDKIMPVICREELNFLNGEYDEIDSDELLWEILKSVNRLSERPIYAITRQSVAQDGGVCLHDNNEIYAIRDTNGEILREFIIKF